MKNPATASLDSANGSSVTAFLPTIFSTSCSNGCPLLNVPEFFTRSNHKVNLAILFSSGKRSSVQLVARKSSRYSKVVLFAVIVTIFVFLNTRRTRSDDQDGLYDFLVANRTGWIDSTASWHSLTKEWDTLCHGVPPAFR